MYRQSAWYSEGLPESHLAHSSVEAGSGDETFLLEVLMEHPFEPFRYIFASFFGADSGSSHEMKQPLKSFS